MSASLASLQTISMMTLGLTALTHTVLLGQFMALRQRLNRMESKLEELAKRIDARDEADLKEGLEFLELGEDFLKRKDKSNGHHRLSHALGKCVGSWKFYGGLLGTELNSAKVRPEAVRILSRHFSVALTATAACQIGLEEDDQAARQLERELPLLRRATQWTFQQTVGREPARFLAPELSQHQVSLQFLADLFRQAKDAGAIESSQPSSEATLFEKLRPRLYSVGRPSFKLRGSWLSEMIVELHQALASVEEMNRVQSLEKVINEAQKAGRKTIEVKEEVHSRVSLENEETCPYVAWAI